jgi:hypothetical protein
LTIYKMDNYIKQYLEKHPNEFQTVMSGTYAFGHNEMEEIIKEALLLNKRFYLKYSNDKEILDFCTYKLIPFRKKVPKPFPDE